MRPTLFSLSLVLVLLVLVGCGGSNPSAGAPNPPTGGPQPPTSNLPWMNTKLSRSNEPTC